MEDFLTGELQQVVNRLMIDVRGPANTSHSIEFYSDASKMIGFGTVLNTKWVRGDWDLLFIQLQNPSIAYLELYALCIGILMWEAQPELRDNRVKVFCKNMGVVEMLNSMTSKCKHCMYLLRLLTLNG